MSVCLYLCVRVRVRDVCGEADGEVPLAQRKRMVAEAGASAAVFHGASMTPGCEASPGGRRTFAHAQRPHLFGAGVHDPQMEDYRPQRRHRNVFPESPPQSSVPYSWEREAALPP